MNNNNDDLNNVYDWFTKEKLFFELKSGSKKYNKLGSYDLDDKCCQPNGQPKEPFLNRLETSAKRVRLYLDDMLEIIQILKR
jgi:hypothetical protein